MVKCRTESSTKSKILKNLLLQATNIHKSFGSLEVLKGIDISIYESEIVSIMGKSGSGKSTLLQILGTLDNPDQGSIEIDSRDVTLMSSAEIAKFRNSKIGFIFQFHHLLNEFTALENVLIPAYIGRNSSKLTIDKAKELLDYLGLSERLEHKPGQLSGGEQQRVAVARALINDPLIIFADEPSGNLDQESSDELHNLFIKLKTDLNQGFVIVTHNQDLGLLSDRTLYMQDGNIIPELKEKHTD